MVPDAHCRLTPEAVMQARLLLRWTSRRAAGRRRADACGRLHKSEGHAGEPRPPTASSGCGSNGVRSECSDLLVVQKTGRREDLVFASATALCRPGEGEACSDAATPPGYHWLLPMEQRPAKAKEPTNLQGIYDLQLSRPELSH